jgi:hypothetical protein
MVSTLASGFVKLASIRIGRLGHPQHARTDESTTFSEEVWVYRKLDSFDIDRAESRRFAQCHRSHPKSVFVPLEQIYDLNATHCLVTGFGLDIGLARLCR